MDMKKIRNWRVKCYNEKDQLSSSFTIKDRTEYDASREAEADPRVLASDGWTMTIIK